MHLDPGSFFVGLASSLVIGAFFFVLDLNFKRAKVPFRIEEADLERANGLLVAVARPEVVAVARSRPSRSTEEAALTAA